MTNIKRVLSVILSVCLIMCFCSFTPQTRENTNVCGDYQYEVLGDGTAKIVKFVPTKAVLDNAVITIPNVLNNKTVTVIGENAFSEIKTMYSVVMPNTITKIEKSAFDGSGLKDVNLSKNILNIYKKAFANTYLSTIVLPKKLTFIGDYAFSNTYITKVVIPKSVKKIGAYAFSTKNSTIKSVDIPKGIKKIGINAFKSLGMTTVKGYSDTVSYEFARCHNLRFKDVETRKVKKAVNYKKLVKKSVKTKLTAVSSRSNNSITVNWNYPTRIDNMRGIKRYVISVSENADFSNAKEYKSKLAYEKTIKGLKSGKIYYVRIKAVAKIQVKWIFGKGYSYNKIFDGAWSKKQAVTVR